MNGYLYKIFTASSFVGSFFVGSFFISERMSQHLGNFAVEKFWFLSVYAKKKVWREIIWV